MALEGGQMFIGETVRAVTRGDVGDSPRTRTSARQSNASHSMISFEACNAPIFHTPRVSPRHSCGRYRCLGVPLPQVVTNLGARRLP